MITTSNTSSIGQKLVGRGDAFIMIMMRGGGGQPEEEKAGGRWW